MEYLSVMKYMIPTKLIAAQVDSEYIHDVHFPWMNEPNYRQAYLATLGMADEQYQALYDRYIDGILLDTLSTHMYTSSISTYGDMIRWIRRDPHTVYRVLGGDLSTVDVLRK